MLNRFSGSKHVNLGSALASVIENGVRVYGSTFIQLPPKLVNPNKSSRRHSVAAKTKRRSAPKNSTNGEKLLYTCRVTSVISSPSSDRGTMQEAAPKMR